MDGCFVEEEEETQKKQALEGRKEGQETLVAVMFDVSLINIFEYFYVSPL